jgi:hypothetical protein
MEKFNKEGLKKKEKFEQLLCEGSSDKTISETLLNLKGKTKVSIENLPIIKNYISIYGLDILAVYKDGLAFTRSNRFPNGCGVTHEYLLHRNGEDKVYKLGELGIESER